MFRIICRRRAFYFFVVFSPVRSSRPTVFVRSTRSPGTIFASRRCRSHRSWLSIFPLRILSFPFFSAKHARWRRSVHSRFIGETKYETIHGVSVGNVKFRIPSTRSTTRVNYLKRAFEKTEKPIRTRPVFLLCAADIPDTWDTSTVVYYSIFGIVESRIKLDWMVNQVEECRQTYVRSAGSPADTKTTPAKDLPGSGARCENRPDAPNSWIFDVPSLYNNHFAKRGRFVGAKYSYCSRLDAF